MWQDDTIAAISTPIGEAGIGIVRISGGHAIKTADMLFSSPKGHTLKKAKSHRILYGFIKDPETDEEIDEVLITLMRAPKTYTKEDVVEINCHGGFISVRRVLGLVLKHGARLAEPGEFTKRAFLNGRLDLSQAEAVADLIRAKTEMAEKIALEQLRGSIGQKINILKDSLIDVCSHIEAHIDFPEEDIEPAAISDIKLRLQGIINELSALSNTYEEGRFLRDGLKAAIVGRPNTGKSSILNALLAKDRAIVTDMPGTTRDVIEDYLNIKGLPVRILDTAGIREAHNMAEEEGVRRSLQAMNDADMVIAVFDGSLNLKDEDMEVIEKIKQKKALIIINKIDLPLSSWAMASKKQGFLHPTLRVSAKTGEGIQTLKDSIFNSSIGSGRSETPSITITNLRHKAAIDNSINALKAGLGAIDGNEPIEIAAIELREGLNRLGEITGTVTAEDILERIFSSFCIGK